jgi:hypothetical protein
MTWLFYSDSKALLCVLGKLAIHIATYMLMIDTCLFLSAPTLTISSDFQQHLGLITDLTTIDKGFLGISNTSLYIVVSKINSWLVLLI